ACWAARSSICPTACRCACKATSACSSASLTPSAAASSRQAMDADFWLERWRDGRTHFHQNRVTPLLQKYWPTLSLPQGASVFVPLCGKSLDMLWIAEQGHRVVGSELSQLAVEQFFDENKLHPATHASAAGQHYVAANIEIIC